MQKPGWLWLILLLLPGMAGAQDVWLPHNSPESRAASRLLADSLAALRRYQQAGQDGATERVATFLLTRYPGRIGFPQNSSVVKGDPYAYDIQYPQSVYAARAAVRRRRGDQSGAAADLAQAVRYGELAYPLATRYFTQSDSYGAPVVAGLRDAYYARAAFRRDELGDAAGSCADLGRAFQLDSLRASNPRFRGCPLPATRAPLTAWDRQRAYEMAQDSLALAQRLLDQHRLREAERVLLGLEAGRTGPYVRLTLGTFTSYARSQLATQRGHYRRAVAYLDTLLPNAYSGNPRYRYERGIIRIDHLNDRTGGCEDLRWVYDHDTTTVSVQHPRWRGCPLPERKIPVGKAELDAHQAAFRDSLAWATTLWQGGRREQAAQVFDRLLASGAAGAYAPYLERHAVTGQLYPRLERFFLRKELYQSRLALQEASGDYVGALADLNALLIDDNFGHKENYEWFCRRGALLADHFPDKREQACYDLNVCKRWDGLPPGKGGWRGCNVGRSFAQQYPDRSGFIGALFAGVNTPILQLGYFHQGQVNGGELGIQLSESGEGYVNYGPSLSVEVGSYNDGVLVGPKLSYEGEIFLVGGRLDLAYYFSNVSRAGDLRLTPQIGLSAAALANVFYGYAIPLAGPEINALGRHRLSIFINVLTLGKLKFWG